MIVLHAGLEAGGLLLWGERPADEAERPAKRPGRKPRLPRPEPHPLAAAARDLDAALMAVQGAQRGPGQARVTGRRGRTAEAFVAWLPTSAGTPVASSPLIAPLPEKSAPVTVAPWAVTALRLSLAESLDLLCTSVGNETLAPGVVVGRDLAYAATALRFAGALVARQQYLPAVEFVDGVHRGVWRPVIAGLDAERLNKLAHAMPDACRALQRKADAPPQTAALPLLIACVAAFVDCLVRSAAPSAPRAARREAASSFDSPHEAWLHALRSRDGVIAGSSSALRRFADQVRGWQRPVVVRAAAPFRLTFRLEEPPPAAAKDATWFVRYLLQAAHDPSLLIPAEEAFRDGRAAPTPLRRAGFDAREHLLAGLGQASGIDARVEASLRASAPSGYALDAAGAFDFLSQRSMALEQAGFGVLLPAWWTRKGTTARLTLTAAVKSPKLQAGSGLGLDALVHFEWQVAVGGVPLTLAELRALARLKLPLVRVRGQWVQVSAEEIAAALEFWRKKGQDAASLRDVVRMSVGAAKTPGGLAFEGVRATGWVGDLLARLQGHAAFTELPAPAGFQGTLRPYQLRGFSWLAFLKECGLGACLADDMGLGKTVQTLALVQREWGSNGKRPTLLICPTSVVGNWEKEAARFTPDLPVLVHHGLGRAKGGDLGRDAARHALVISSYALLHRDFEALKDVGWSGVILDEAQNIKNPETKQARAARTLPAGYRIVLTGTPVENHVGDLWSLMEFLNPGFLGTQAEFKRTFFVPIQAGHDPEAAARLRRVTGPFVLRRLKTDKAIIADLPEKMEMKVYCTLTREQASLYAAVVTEAAEDIETSEGIERKGIVLATLSKLKQVCNHPAQFLKDNSALPGRSGKLARLTEMLEEILEVGDRALVFTQFSEMGGLLQHHLQETFGREALFLHGGVPKGQRDRMIERFQEAGGPLVFVLSLKAGGTGLNLTRANHVFHFDRWWNPAVENQATDRAFRIGQLRRVQVHKFLCAGTLEEKIDAMMEGKKDVAERVVGTGEGWLTELTTAELVDLMSLRPEAVAE
ncbi:MAG TPA: DEAD/DEAH box helicase [Vicinamibacteria bacterium]|nr:DEAD/DEAH box helicase [Vicinamibacteria bacterium]